MFKITISGVDPVNPLKYGHCFSRQNVAVLRCFCIQRAAKQWERRQCCTAIGWSQISQTAISRTACQLDVHTVSVGGPISHAPSTCRISANTVRPSIIVVIIMYYNSDNNTPWAIKTCHFVFDYNSGFSFSIFILFAPVERWRNTLYTLHPNCVSTLPGKIKTTSKQHILKSIITVRSIEPELTQKFFHCSSFPILGRKFFYQSSVRKIFTFPQVFDKK